MIIPEDAENLADMVIERDERIAKLEAAVKTIRTHYEFTKRPYDDQSKVGYKDGPIKDAVISALSFLLVNVEDILKTES